MAELDGLEPDTEYTVRVWANVDGVEGPPTSVVVRTGEWTLDSCQPCLGYAALLCVPDCSVCPLHHCSAASLPTLVHPTLTPCLPTANSWLLHTAPATPRH